MVNINKLLPRLTIRAKLAIAFVILAILPFVAVSGFAVRYTVQQVRSLARATLESELGKARVETERLLQDVEHDVAYLASEVLGPLLRPRDPAVWEAGGRSVSSLLSYKPVLYQIRVLDGDGTQLLVVRAGDVVSSLADDVSSEGLYYAVRAESVELGKRLLLPVELRGDLDRSDSLTTVPAIAIVAPVRDSGGTLEGVVVGEAHAPALFGALDRASAQLGGVTGLVDAEGWHLYHSERKRNWSRLLASRSELDLAIDLSDAVAESILAGRAAATLPTADERIVSFVHLKLAENGLRPLVLYRVVPLSALESGVRGFLGSIALGGLAMFLVVLLLAALAAHQFTQPIYALRRGTRRLAAGEYTPLEIATKDELEDLAADFSTMARALSEQRDSLEDLVREQTRALRETHAELEGILEHSADAIIGLDGDSRVRVWNDGAEATFGYSASEATGRDINELLLPDGADWKVEAEFIRREATNGGAVVNFQTRRHGRDGIAFPVSLTLSAIRGDQDNLVGYSLIVRDISLQARLEEQMRRSERLAVASVMTAGLAHELGNPLAVIGNRIDCIEQEVRERGEVNFLAEDLGVLREHTDRLDRVIRDVLRFARGEPGEREPVDVSQTAARVVGLLQRTYQSREVNIETDLADSLPRPLANEQDVETVCINLLMNAIDATPRGGTVSVATRPSRDSTAVELEVSDTGPGVPPELRHQIFEPFFTTKRSNRATGLGLAVCQTIIERHGGRISVEGGPGEGSRFVVLVPLKPVELPWPNGAFSS
jgi:PAS domain S-box-containing protein